MISITIPIKTVSTLNVREHWSVRSKRAKAQRLAVRRSMVAGVAKQLPLPVVVTIERLAPSNGLDGDNLQGALKSVRDGVADCYGIDDRDGRITWRYSQRRDKGYAVVIQIEEARYA